MPLTDGGVHFAKEGTDFGMRALPDEYLNYNRIVYKVEKPLPVDVSFAAPWGEKPGMGIQYETKESIDYLLGNGYIKIVDIVMP